MAILHLDCSAGVAGDMLAGALLDLMPDREACIARLDALEIPDISFSCRPDVKCGVVGLHMDVTALGRIEGVGDVGRGIEAASEEVDGHVHGHGHGCEHGHIHTHGHAHGAMHGHDHTREDDVHTNVHAHAHEEAHGRTVADVAAIIDSLDMDVKVRDDAKAVFRSIAEAEAAVHGRSIEQIHFHEVGTMDAVADVVAVCWLINELAPERITASPIRTGYGHVRCAHGVLPVPAPATALLLEGVPSFAGDVEGELCTPTGTALVRRFADSFSPMPAMRISASGYGTGTKDLPILNAVRAIIGSPLENGAEPNGGESIVKLECNIDDATAEALGFAMEELLKAGARDVWLSPVQMKNLRPGTLLSVIATRECEEQLVETVFRTTPTLGIRRIPCDRYVLERRIENVATPYGEVRVKCAHGYGTERSKAEYADIARIARETGSSIDETRRIVTGWIESSVSRP